MIRILICDDQVVVREGLNTILSSANANLEIVGLATDGADALDLVSQTHPDVVLMDLKMPHMNGVQATRKILAEYPNVRVLVLTTYDVDEWVFDAIRAGAAGYLLKDTDQETLVKAIYDVYEGKTPIDPQVAGKLFSQVAQSTPRSKSNLAEKLSQRELEVLNLLGKGFSNAQIAKQLFLTEGTVRNYLSAIFAKLNVSDRTQAAVLALRYGLVAKDK